MHRAPFLRCLSVALALAGAAAAPSASAQQPRPTAGARNTDAVKRADAEAAFLTAWTLNPTFDVACNLGLTQFKLGKHRDAAEHLAFAIRHWPLIGPPARRQNAQNRLHESKAHVGALTVKVNVDHADVLVDGKKVGLAPLDLEVFVEPGRHTVEARLDGYDAATQMVEAGKGTAVTVTLALAKTPVPVPEPVAKAPEPDASPKKDATPGPVADAAPTRREEQPQVPPAVLQTKRSVIPGAVLGWVAGAAVVTGAVLLAVGASKRSTWQTTSTSIQSEHHTCIMGALNYDPRCAQLIDGAHASVVLEMEASSERLELPGEVGRKVGHALPLWARAYNLMARAEL